MMKKFKIFGIYGIYLLVCTLFVSVYGVRVVTAVEGFSAEDKLPSLLGDVLGLDMSKYTILCDGFRTRSEFGFEVEDGGFLLVDAKGGVVSGRGRFYNGYPDSINISPQNGSLYYAIEPPKGSVEKMKNIYERYTIFAQKYELVTLDKSVVFDLLTKTPSNLPKSYLSSAKVSSDDMILEVSKEGFAFGCSIDGFMVQNKGWAIAFTDKKIVLSDTFGLYSFYDLGIFSKEEVTNFAFDLAKKYANALFVESEVKPDWSNMHSEVSLGMIPGQFDNNNLNNAFLEVGVGNVYSVERDPTVLYPFWSAIFYFNSSIGNIDGIQVGVWGDTGEVAYCYERGHLGSVSYPSDVTVSESTGLDGRVIAVIVVLVLLCVVCVVVFIKKNRL
ncbi:MAG: hypothetical protein FWH37_06025 [Candidatus Bathyarchaeota archaeon]|nr:hypothetical protein [Candidatus Termiticorpusculum sp.]